jgi:hypothetical protein
VFLSEQEMSREFKFLPTFGTGGWQRTVGYGATISIDGLPDGIAKFPMLAIDCLTLPK